MEDDSIPKSWAIIITYCYQLECTLSTVKRIVKLFRDRISSEETVSYRKSLQKAHQCHPIFYSGFCFKEASDILTRDKAKWRRISVAFHQPVGFCMYLDSHTSEIESCSKTTR